MQRRTANSNTDTGSTLTQEARELATTFSALEFATIGIDAVAGSLGELGATVEGAARSANMNRRALLASRYATLYKDISTLDAARKRGLETILGGAQDVAETVDVGTEDFSLNPTLALVGDINGFKDTALIEAARESIAKARESLERVAGTYRERASEIADRLAALGENLTLDSDGQAIGGERTVDTDTSKRGSLRARILRGLLGDRAA